MLSNCLPGLWTLEDAPELMRCSVTSDPSCQLNGAAPQITETFPALISLANLLVLQSGEPRAMVMVMEEEVKMMEIISIYVETSNLL
jgi:hypothetical protein